jgi:4-hydroxy-tetrahydrodipicolinate reductase
MIKLVITGIGGKMGNTLLGIALKDMDFEVVGVTEAKGHPLIGKDIAPGLDEEKSPIIVSDDLSRLVDVCDVVVDFTQPKPSLEHFRIAESAKKAIVIGTTGFPGSAIDEINNAKDVRVVISPNMSVGMNLMFDVVERIARILKNDYDIEIVEMHHKWKKDAPSGTAMRIKDVIQKALPEKSWIEVFGRKGITGERKNEEIGIMTLRGGDVVGEHTAIFAGIGERLEVTHRAYSRENFARGALIAAKWVANQPYGIYSMKDVLGL